jgi:hypothetical protein
MMSNEYDYLRPRQAPASVLYDAFQAEAVHRKSRDLEEWIRLELEAVHRAACSYAAGHGLHQPSMEEVAAAERYARGSADCGSKWAIVLTERMQPLNPDQIRSVG